MIEKMTCYTFVLARCDEDRFLESLQGLGLVDVRRSSKPVDEHSSASMAEAESLRQRISDIERGRLERDSQYVALIAGRDAAKKELAATEPWGDFNRAKVDGLGALGLKMRFYEVSSKRFHEEWRELHALEKVSDDGKTVHFVTVGPVDGYEFPIAEVPAPEHSTDVCRQNLRLIEEQIEERRQLLESETALLPELRKQYAGIVSGLEMYLAKVSGEHAAEECVTVITGFAPVSDDARIHEFLDNAGGIYWTADAATVEENPPIKFRNNRFARMYETFTDMYGRPAYDGFDPTPFISVFFMLFFAFCMGDAGYGLLLIVIGLLLKRVESFSRFSPLVICLGTATAVIGFLFHTFFSMDISQWKCLEGINRVFLPSKIMGYDGTMVLSLVVGVIHLSLAMIVKTVMTTKNKGFLNSLGTWGWTLLIVGGVIVGALALTGVLDKTATKWIVIILGTLSALGIFFLNDLHRNPLLNIGSGLWETYNTATGLLGDVLSYLRLYALGLAGGMLGLAFNDIGMMIVGDGSSALMWIPAVLVFIIGHTLNIAMATLGAFVHPLRLNFLEFFKNSGYEATGQPFRPFRKLSIN